MDNNMIVRLADRTGKDRRHRKGVPRFSCWVPKKSHGTVAVVIKYFGAHETELLLELKAGVFGYPFCHFVWKPRPIRPGASRGVILLASIYADFAIPLEFELDKRGRKTDQPIPLDLMSTRFLGKMFLVVPLLAALAAHLAEPGLLTTDKAKKNQ